jgi:hypothetical protein
MRQISPYSLWIGNIGDVEHPEQLSRAGIQALVDLAENEKPTLVFRDLVYCRFPLVDGGGNSEWLLRMAVETVARLIRTKIPTLVFCSAGLSRSPSIVAAALSLIDEKPLSSGFEHLKACGTFDCSTALWLELESIFNPPH